MPTAIQHSCSVPFYLFFCPTTRPLSAVLQGRLLFVVSPISAVQLTLMAISCIHPMDCITRFTIAVPVSQS